MLKQWITFADYMIFQLFVWIRSFVCSVRSLFTFCLNNVTNGFYRWIAMQSQRRQCRWRTFNMQRQSRYCDWETIATCLRDLSLSLVPISPTVSHRQWITISQSCVKLMPFRSFEDITFAPAATNASSPAATTIKRRLHCVWYYCRPLWMVRHSVMTMPGSSNIP